jgi:hypothetical protein
MEHADDMRSLLENSAGERLTFLGESISGSYAQVRSRITTNRRVEMIGTGVGAVGGREPDEEVWAMTHRA